MQQPAAGKGGPAFWGRPRRSAGGLPRLVVVARRRHEGEALRFEHFRHADEFQIAEFRPTIWTPMGSPSSTAPGGMTVAGR